MPLSQPSASWGQWLAALAGALDPRSAPRLVRLLLDALLAAGRRTVIAWLQAAGLSAEFRPAYHTVAAAVAGSPPGCYRTRQNADEALAVALASGQTLRDAVAAVCYRRAKAVARARPKAFAAADHGRMVGGSPAGEGLRSTFRSPEIVTDRFQGR
jgi:hypothetical protein